MPELTAGYSRRRTGGLLGEVLDPSQVLNGGESWSPVVDSGVTSLAVNDLKIDPLKANRIYAATYGGGIFELTLASQTVDGLTFDATTVQVGDSFTATFARHESHCSDVVRRALSQSR